METNLFITNPIKIIKWNLDKNEWQYQLIVILGPRDKKIKDEISRIAKSSSTTQSSNILLKEFGKDWYNKLGFGEDLQFSPIAGGAINDEEIYDIDPDLSLNDNKNTEGTIDISDFIEINDNIDTLDTKVHNQTFVEISHKKHLAHIYDIVIFPEDKISDIKYKINRYLNIPIFRQHLWYMNRGQCFPLKYTFLQSGSMITVNMLKEVIMHKVNENDEKILGIPINMFLYKNKDTLKIESSDQFTLIGNIHKKYNINELHLVDLDNWIDPIRTELRQLSATDKYQLNILYYSFILKYFPLMNIAAFEEYIEDASLKNSYPQLEPNIDELSYIDHQQSLILELYNLMDQYPEVVNTVDSEIKKSLTHTTLKVTSNYKSKILNFRVLFDKFELDDNVDAMRLYDIYDNRHLILNKTYGDNKKSVDKIIPNVIYFRVIVSRNPYQKLNLYIYPNGSYAIEASWNEELMYQFDNINHIIHMYITPVIKKINMMKCQVMYQNNYELPMINPSNIRYIDINISLFWKHAISTEMFKLMKSLLEKFASAHIIQEKILEKNMYSYFFKKGMFELDAKRIEKQSSINNYYAYLFNSDVRQKWFALFENIRVLNIIHRFSDIKLEISGIKEDEYYIFIRYIILLFIKFKEMIKSTKGDDDNIEKRMNSKPLNSLKEQDPELYNLKQHGSNIVFSKICQKPFQPNLINEEQFNKLNKDQKKNVVKYWNFTTKTSAYYKCPNAKLPYIKFITDKHPKGYCIPCCKKTPISDKDTDKQRIVYETCLRDGKCTKKDVAKSSSRYIMNYGKAINIGRLSNLPESTMEPLFYDSIMETSSESLSESSSESPSESPNKLPNKILNEDSTEKINESSNKKNRVIETRYYLYGIPQTHPNINDNIGYLYTLSNALNLNLEELIKDTIKRIKDYPDYFPLLFNGNIVNYFVSYKVLCDTLYSIFIMNDEFVNLNDFANWNQLFIEIANMYFNIFTIVFEDKNTVIQLNIPKYMTTYTDYQNEDSQHLIVLHNLGNFNWNPIYIIHKDIYFRTGIIDTKLYNFKSDIIQAINDIIKYKFTTSLDSNSITFDVVRRFIENHKKYQIDKLHLTYDNLCYAISVKNVGYIPIQLSYVKLFNLTCDISFTVDDIKPAMIKTLEDFMDSYNNWVAIESEKAGFTKVNIAHNKPLIDRVEPIYPYMKIEQWLIYKNKFCGFKNNNMNYYINPITINEGLKIQKCSIVELIYNPLVINKILQNHKTIENKKDEREKNINHALYQKYSYHLLLLNFIKYFNSQKNTQMRLNIKKLMAKTNFQGDLREFHNDLDTLMRKYSGLDTDHILFQSDIDKLRSMILEFISSGKNKKYILLIFDNDHFNFDNLSLERLKKMPKPQINYQLSKIANDLVDTKSNLPKNFEFPNILTNCSNSNEMYCSKSHKLILDKDKLQEYISILTDEIRNPFTEKYLFSPLFIDNLVDYFKFIKRPMEHIEIEYI
jgi:hypothetical protein